MVVESTSIAAHHNALASRAAVYIGALLTVVLFALGCSSPLDLDVDRDIKNIDNKVSPTRMSLYYHFGNQGYEAIVTNQELLKSIIVEKFTDTTFPCTVTIPQFLFTLSDTMQAFEPFSPFIRAFSFSCNKQPADQFFRNAVGENSWMAVDLIDIDGTHKAYNWRANNAGREIRIAFYTIPGENLVKGFAQFIIIKPNPADPTIPEFVSYSALITMEFDPYDYSGN